MPCISCLLGSYRSVLSCCKSACPRRRSWWWAFGLHCMPFRIFIWHEFAQQLREPSAIARAGAPFHVQRFMQALHTDTWFTIGDQSDLVRTEQGSRPGDSYADVVFGLLWAKLLRTYESKLVEAEVLTYIPGLERPSLVMMKFSYHFSDPHGWMIWGPQLPAGACRDFVDYDVQVLELPHLPLLGGIGWWCRSSDSVASWNPTTSCMLDHLLPYFASIFGYVHWRWCWTTECFIWPGRCVYPLPVEGWQFAMSCSFEAAWLIIQSASWWMGKQVCWSCCKPHVCLEYDSSNTASTLPLQSCASRLCWTEKTGRYWMV